MTKLIGFAILCLACGGCCAAAPWTARVCASNASGNCQPVDLQPHPHTVKSTSVGPVTGVTDVDVREPACANGMGAVDVQVVDCDDLQVTIHCLNDAPSHTMTLPPAPAPASPAPSNGGH